VESGPKENGHRPSIDTLFRSAAESFGPRVIGVVLTGALSDGAAGLATIKDRGGIAIVQDPEEAFNPSMPLSALRLTPVDHTLRVTEIAPCLVKLSDGKAPQRKPSSRHRPTAPNPPPNIFICPECGGALHEQKAAGDVTAYRCLVGHGYTLPALVGNHEHTTEAALWRAVRSLRERATMLQRLAQQTGVRDFAAKAGTARRDADIIERMLPGVLK
jgi:two-component system chemotaxis response regulator CheB